MSADEPTRRPGADDTDANDGDGARQEAEQDSARPRRRRLQRFYIDVPDPNDFDAEGAAEFIRRLGDDDHDDG